MGWENSEFWADVAAAEIVAGGSQATVATGITPSGDIHIGNLREVLTAAIMVNAITQRGSSVDFIYIADDFDPLRRVYPFLDETTFAPHVGKPLSEIPSPDGKAKSYADCFLQPFLRSLEALNIKVRLVRASEQYKSGAYVPFVIKALENKDLIRDILREETGKKTDETWSPFNAMCEKDGRITTTHVTGFDAEAKTVSYTCECGHSGQASMAGGGKLTWRVDWPARWAMLGVTVEPFGKDHASRGGSYDTGKRIAKEVFGLAAAPFPMVYEWISLKGGGDMSSSKGNTISIAEMVDVVPPDALKYLIARVKPQKRIGFDPGLALLNVIDEFDDPKSKQRNDRAAELSLMSQFDASEDRVTGGVGVAFKHIVILAQIYEGDVDRIVASLKKMGVSNIDRMRIASRTAYALKWLKRFGPEDMKFSVQKSLPEAASALQPIQKKALGLLGERLDESMDGSAVHELIYQIKQELELEPKELFSAIYQSILGKAKGPRAGLFVSSLDASFAKQRFAEVADSQNQ